MKVKCRLSDRAEDFTIKFQEKESASVIISRIQDKIGLDKRVQLMHFGKPIGGGPLVESGWKEGQVLNAFVSG